MSKGPLEGYRVIELGQLLAGPFTGCLLGYFGAEIIKLEKPKGGDPIRGWREVQDGTSLWWHSLGRNKKSVTVDLRTPEGIEIVRKLIDSADVVIENFRPGTVEKWGVGPEAFKESNPNLVYARISGYGQTGPNANKPGFASVTEGYSGFRYLNGFPGERPVRPNLSIGDSISGLHAALGITMALLNCERGGTGQVVDVALYESMFNLMEAVIPEYDGAGLVREPSGSSVTGIAPTDTYSCKDNKYIVIGGNGDSIFKRLMECVGYKELGDATRFATNTGRVENIEEINKILDAWCAVGNSKDRLAELDSFRVPAGPIYSVEDMIKDEHYQARGMFEEVTINGKPLKIPSIVPKLSETAGSTKWSGPTLGQHNTEILQDMLGMSDDELKKLSEKGVV